MPGLFLFATVESRRGSSSSRQIRREAESPAPDTHETIATSAGNSSALDQGNEILK
jgi:hypothetical protein